jgi:hypothetical protein
MLSIESWGKKTTIRYIDFSKQGFFGLFYSRYLVIFPIENRILFSQSSGKKFPVESYKIKILNKNSKIFENKGFFAVTVFKCLPS